jgi:hypothetical protein
MGIFNPMLQHDETEWSSGQPEPFEYHAHRKSIMLWILVAVLAAAFGALIYYGYRTVKTQDIRITQVFGRQGTMTTLGQRADAAESKIHDLAGNWQTMGDRMTKLETRVGADIKGTRAYAETLTQRLHQQMTAEMNSRTSPLEARISQLESQVQAEQTEQRAQMAQVESVLKQDIAQAQAESGRDLMSVREQEDTNARGVSALSERLDRRRVDFEVAKGQTRELIPGVALKIRSVNQGRQNYRGSLQLLQGQRTVWLRDQSVQAPVRFFNTTGGGPYELVVTNVTKKDVAGYLLTPVKTNTTTTGAAVGQQRDENAPASE